MFHLIHPTDHDDLPEIVDDLKRLAGVLVAAFELPDEALTSDDVRLGYARFGSAFIHSMDDLSDLIRKQRRAAPAVFDFSTPAMPGPDRPELVPAEGFIPDAPRAGLEGRIAELERANAELTAELERRGGAPVLSEPVPDDKPKGRRSSAA